MRAPLRDSFRTDRSIAWIRVHNLADYVYFDHGIHLDKGIGCVSCHGQVNEMPLMWREVSLYMEWCLECHRHPELYIRPRAEVFNMNWSPPTDRDLLGPELVAAYGVKKLTNCSVCHR